MSLKIVGSKKGMTRVFDKNGNAITCTVIHLESNVIVQIKNLETDGYTAVQVGGISLTSSRKKNLGKPVLGHYSKSKVEPKKRLLETRVDNVDSYQVGQLVSLDQFAEGSFVDVTATSKGKGFQGVIKRHNFKGGPGAHGSGFHRHGGSTGMRSTPGRVFLGQKMPGHMGDEKVTVQNLKVIRVDAEKGVLLVQGAVPGARSGMVVVRKAIKK